MTSVYTFNNKANYTDASITSQSGSFVVRSTQKPDVTVINGPSKTEGLINWEEKTFHIDGEVLPVDDIRMREKGPGLVSLRRWTYNKVSWHFKYEYETKTWFVWRLRDDTAEPKACVEFTLYQSKVIGNSTAATVTVDPSVSDADALFLLMALIYCESTEHPPNKFSVTNGVLGALTALSKNFVF
ncbi:hypothetical protein H0H92_007737 [Tricholoma furcatifolium]|nr:hypothetical protein H0H92_007737 [Tricholoma furcatifolium]